LRGVLKKAMNEEFVTHVRENNRVLEHVAHFYAEPGREWDGGEVARAAIGAMVGRETSEDELEIGKRSVPQFTVMKEIPEGCGLLVAVDLREIARQGGIEDPDTDYLNRLFNTIQEILPAMVRDTGIGNVLIHAKGINFCGVVRRDEPLDIRRANEESGTS
jgi:hypothetical protein